MVPNDEFGFVAERPTVHEPAIAEIVVLGGEHESGAAVETAELGDAVPENTMFGGNSTPLVIEPRSRVAPCS